EGAKPRRGAAVSKSDVGFRWRNRQRVSGEDLPRHREMQRKGAGSRTGRERNRKGIEDVGRELQPRRGGHRKVVVNAGERKIASRDQLRSKPASGRAL